MKTLIDTFKALGNDNRLQMLIWLHRSSEHFPDYKAECTQMQTGGWICVSSIAEKAGLAQSVVSGYLNTLKSVGLVESQRESKWTYYRFNHAGFDHLFNEINQVFPKQTD